MNYYWIYALENVGLTAIFAWVAIHFDRWWIVLFAILGWNYFKTQKQR